MTGTCRVCRRKVGLSGQTIAMHGEIGAQRRFEHGGWRLPRCPGSYLAPLRRGRRRRITIPGPYSGTGL